ncbi:TraB family protein [Halovenus aranensis]|uniref:TraB family protein n=2 Tax=Halovenus aranensis TaxID=890420 RepID=A0A1G8XFM9_9EURY|nr:TraB/GumN family protein [Halovenus aranensis]SDJ88590.1 TraB family protein [Halovenus aranensis]
MTDGGSGDVLDADETAVAPQSRGGGSVTVVGTAHVSHDSVEEVEQTIAEQQPDVVAVELDETRYKRMQGEAPDDIDAGDVISGKTVYQFLAYWMLSYVQARLGDRFDIEPGADMMAAIDAAEEHGSGVALVDRDIQLTVRRLWSRMRLREKLAIVAALLVEMGGAWTAGLTVGFFLGTLVAIVASALGGPYLVPSGIDVGVPLVGGLLSSVLGLLDGLAVATAVAVAVGTPIALLLVRSTRGMDEAEIDLDRLTDADVVTAMIEEFRRFSPGGAEALIDERDAYIAHRLVALREAGYDVVAVVGAGHRAGIERYLDHPEELPPGESLVGEPSTSRLRTVAYKTIGYAFTLGFLAFFVLLAVAGVRGTFLLRVFVVWFVVNGLAAGALAKLAGAHWSSATVGGAVAWLTSVNPLLAPGWFAGYVELRYTSVNVADISKLNDMLSDDERPMLSLVKDMRDEVPTFRLILIVAMTNIGSFLASVFFAAVLLPYLASDIGGVTELGQQMLDGASESARLIWETVT